MNKELSIKEIKSEDSDELIWIANSRTNFWSFETKKLVRSELVRRKISLVEQKKIWSSWKVSIENEKEYEQIYLDTKKSKISSNEYNKTKFTVLEKFGIFFFAPFDLVKLRSNGSSLLSLYRDNKMSMFWEKLVLIVSGILIWTGITLYSIQKSEKKRMEGIEKIDISDWEKKHGYD